MTTRSARTPRRILFRTRSARPSTSAALLLAAGLLALLPGASSAQQGGGASADVHNRYVRAEQRLTWNTAPLVYRDAVEPVWRDGSRFWYPVATRDGRQFVKVDAAANRQEPVFDNARLASAMSEAADTAYAPHELPFDDFVFVDGADDRIRFRAGAREFDCRLGPRYACAAGDTTPTRPASHILSSDGRWEAYVEDHDLWVRPVDGGGAPVRLTDDGEDGWAYGVTRPRANAQRNPSPRRPTLEWSPDSRRIAVQRTDERDVETMVLYSSTSARPEHWEFPYAIPGDSIIPRYDIHVVDVESRSNVRVRMPPQSYQVNGITGIGPDSSWVTVQWAGDSDDLYFLHALRGPKRIQVMRADAETGAASLIAKDSAATFVELNLDNSSPPNWRVLDDEEDVIWFSERDGWGRLYRYGADGTLKSRITAGPWAVATIQHVDQDAHRVYFTARGREEGDPYITHLYRVGLDGSGLTRLTPEDADHRVSFSPDGRFFVDTYSRVDEPPVTMLRRADGTLIRTLEEADASDLVASGWRPGEPFTVKARDGVTDLYGVLWKPTDFDSTKTYPVIDHIYPGPQIIATPKRFFPTKEPGLAYATFGQVQALAELGFVVIHVDAMGTPHRSKAYLDTWYGDMGDNGLPDHVAAIHQLAARHPWIDADRVGIYGHSGGGFASTDALLRYPDVFDVAVSTSGNHDNRNYQYHWGEKYQGLMERDTLRGPDSFEDEANYTLAENLRGKLFLMHGDLDDNVLPTQSLRMADALVKANKSFDFLILPDMDHGVTQDPYVIRRTWDYFVEHLRGERPPVDYPLGGPPEG